MSADALAVKRAHNFATKKNTVEKSLVGQAKMVIQLRNELLVGTGSRLLLLSGYDEYW